LIPVLTEKQKKQKINREGTCVEYKRVVLLQSLLKKGVEWMKEVGKKMRKKFLKILPGKIKRLLLHSIRG
jgi:hypothetical protein